jgi:hypothetical protein
MNNKSENIKKYYIEKYKKKIVIDKYLLKSKNDVMDRIINNLRRRAYPYKKKIKITNLELLGCSKDELKNHLEIHFKENMGFENYGKWEIDHIKPLASYNLNNQNEILECFNYKNLQPLWKDENMKKSDKYITP